MDFFNIATSIDPRRSSPAGLSAFLVGILCGIGITVIASSLGNLEIAKLPIIESAGAPIRSASPSNYTAEAETDKVVDNANPQEEIAKDQDGTPPTVNATLLLETIYDDLGELEDMFFDYIPEDKEELPAAHQRMMRFQESLKQAILSFAIMHDDLSFVSRQIADTPTTNWEALRLAIRFDRIKVVQWLLASSKLDNNLKHLGFEEAAYQGRMEIMDLFMRDNTIDANGCIGTNPLKAAAGAGQVDAMRRLIGAGADLEARGKTSMLKERDHTPLVAAVARKQFQAATVLVEAGAAVNNENEAKNLPLRIALEAGFGNIVVLLLNHGARADALGLPRVWEDMLGLAVAQGHLELAEKAIEAGANVNRTMPLYGTLLKRAITTGREKMIKLLLEHGADMDYTGSVWELGGNCALLAAASCRNANIFLRFLEHSALIDIANGKFGNLMQTVAHLGYADHLQAILKAKPDIDAESVGSSKIPLSPLSMAVGYHQKILNGKAKAVEGSDHLQVIRLLLAHKKSQQKPDPVVLGKVRMATIRK